MNKIIALLFSGFISLASWAQSYQQMESRFNRVEPTKIDSAAYINLGIQRAESLFQLSNLHAQNMSSNMYSNQSMQVRIEDRIQKSFTEPNLDDEGVQRVLTRIHEAAPNGESIRFEHVKLKGTMGYIKAINSAVPLEFSLLLKKVEKKFGDESEWVWDVFLSEHLRKNNL